MNTRILVMSLGLLGFCACRSEPQSPALDPPTEDRSRVSALGRLEPGLGVVDIGAPPGERVRSLRVAEGQVVAKGDVLAILESFEERRTDVEVRRAVAEEARHRLRRARDVGPLAIAGRAAAVRRLEADLALAISDLRRTRDLVASEVVPEREQEFQEAVEAQAKAALDEARTLLEQESRERELAVDEARAALHTAEATLARGEATLAQSEIRAPTGGEVLDLIVLEGEATDSRAILRLGEIQKMYAVAEVYETDARFVREGQRATVTSPALGEPLTGRVTRISDLVHKNDVLGIDPAADTDARVLEARILLDPTDVAARFIHLQVDVTIETAPPETAPPETSADEDS